MALKNTTGSNTDGAETKGKAETTSQAETPGVERAFSVNAPPAEPGIHEDTILCISDNEPIVRVEAGCLRMKAGQLYPCKSQRFHVDVRRASPCEVELTDYARAEM